MIRWVDAFLDRPAGTLDRAVRFWAEVTGTTPAPPRIPGFVRLHVDGSEAGGLERTASAGRRRPAAGGDGAGRDWLEIQELREGPAGTHPDLWVDDLPGFLASADNAGAERVRDHGGWWTLRTPGGQPFCVAAWSGPDPVRPEPHLGPDGIVLRAHQICFDLAPSVFDADVAFWRTVTGWRFELEGGNEFRRLVPEPPIPIRFLLQRLGEERSASAHLDVSCSDRPAARAWHERLGAVHLGTWPYWTTLRDPAGGVYCLTKGDPWTD
jgi:hypothetical protein